MTPQEFKKSMDKMVGIYNPRGWQANSEASYYDVVRRWPVQDWDRVVDVAISRSEYMPKPAQLIAIEKEQRQRKSSDLASCPNCFIGWVPIQVEKGGIVYDRVAACDCKSGASRAVQRIGGRRVRRYSEMIGSPPPPLNSGPSATITDSPPPVEDITALKDLPF